MDEKETPKPEQTVPTEELLLTEKGDEIILEIHKAVLRELQRKAVGLDLGTESVRAYVEHLNSVYDIALEMVDELREKSVEISLEDKRAIEIDTYLHDVCKFVPEAGGPVKGLFVHGEASAEFAKTLLLKMGFSEEYAERRARDIREHMAMPYIVMEAKATGIRNKAIEQAWRAWEGLSEGEQEGLQPPPAEKVVMPWIYQPEESGVESLQPSSFPAVVTRAADFLSLGQLKSGCFDKIVRICLEWEDLGEATKEAQLGFARNVVVLRLSKNSSLELARVERIIGEGKFGGIQESKIASFREFVGTRRGELPARSREGFRDLEVYQKDGFVDIDATMKNYYQAVEEFKKYQKEKNDKEE